MIGKIAEHKLQSYIQSDPHVLRYGGVANASGEIDIDFGYKFIEKPFFMCEEVEIDSSNTDPVVCFLTDWITDTDGYYTGAKVQSDGKGTGLMWIAIGIGVENA